MPVYHVDLQERRALFGWSKNMLARATLMAGPSLSGGPFRITKRGPDSWCRQNRAGNQRQLPVWAKKRVDQPAQSSRRNRPLTGIRRPPFSCWNWGMYHRGESAKSTGQDDRSALPDYDDGVTCTVMISMSLYLWCWTEDA